MAGIMTHMDVTVRPATTADGGAGLLYESARPYYDAFAGHEARARRLLGDVWAHPGHAASWEICTVAETSGKVAGVLAGYPVAEGDRLAQRFLWLALRRMPPWQWAGVTRHLRASGRVAPVPPPGTFYVDALAVAPEWRRRGIGRRLLHEAERQAGAAGLGAVALDTGLENEPARALYSACGFTLAGERAAPDELTARAVGGRGVAAYVKPVRRL
jgi:ribosomal protein S18 acetylase RimI-like enzyme